VFCLSVAPSVMAASAEDEVLLVAKNFDKAANTVDFQLLSSLYWHSSKTSQFDPNTGFPFLYQGWEQMEKIWTNRFEGTQKGSVTMTMHHPQVTMLGDNAAVVTCYSTVTVNPPSVKEQTISQYRVTRVLQKIDGKWLIVHDHASPLPVK